MDETKALCLSQYASIHNKVEMLIMQKVKSEICCRTAFISMFSSIMSGVHIIWQMPCLVGQMQLHHQMTGK